MGTTAIAKGYDDHLRDPARVGSWCGPWLFIGNDDAGDVNAAFVSLLASCKLHDIEPWAYLRDLLCLLPSWPSSRVLELAPVNWHKTLEQGDTQQQLAANVFRRFTLDKPLVHCRSK